MALSLPLPVPEGERADFSSGPELLTPSKPFLHQGSMMVLQVRDERDGDGRIVCGTSEDDPGKWGCSCVALVKTEDHLH